jgi:site-specific recombinase XerD
MEWNLIEKQHEFLRVLEQQGKSFNTVKNYKADLQCFNTFLIQKQEHLKLRSFTPIQAQEYSQFLDNKYGSPNSVRRRVQALRLFFDFLLGQQLFPDNPIKQMAVAPKVLDNPNPTPFGEIITAYHLLKKKLHTQDANTLAQLVASRNVIIFHLIYGSALKVSDMAKLHLNSVLKDKNKYRVLVEHPRRDPYSVPLPESFNEDFLAYKTLYHKLLAQEDLEIDELLFNANPYRILSGGLSPRGTELFFEELRKLLKTEMTAKSLRQACIFKWLRQGINHATIKEWLGVTPSYTLDLYLEELKKNPEGFIFNELEDHLVQ